MPQLFRLLILLAVMPLLGVAAPRKGPRAATPVRAPDWESANDPAVGAAPVRRAHARPAILRAQVLLDRAHFSPGEIDARAGESLRRALRSFQGSRGLPASGNLDPDTWTALNADKAPVLARVAVSEEDSNRTFSEVPADMAAKAALTELEYSSPLEALGERFHAAPSLLTSLNAGETAWTPGTEIRVPAVHSEAPGHAASLIVDGNDLSVSALDRDNRVLARYPASVGSEHDPLPVGDWKIRGVARMPAFHYNPELFWDADAGDTKSTLPPGPNSPVGVVWIDLSKEHYGIHGSPEPSAIGKTQSHGCIRLTNWDAWELAGMVSPGTPAKLTR